jgi:uncharacterized protein with GYD domain
MPYYMWTGSYTPEAMQALIRKPQDREAVVRKVVEAAGGKMHHAFVSLGTSDFVLIAEFPDDTSAVAVSLAVGASGAVGGGMTTKLITMSEFAKAQKKAGKVAARYKPPQR